MPMVLERTTQKLQERPVTHTPFASSGAEIDDKLNDTFAFSASMRRTSAEQELMDLLQEGLDELERGEGRDADEALAEICAELGL